jgi:hypothetical protein
MKYRSKQLVEAIQWTGDNYKEITSFCPDFFEENEEDDTIFERVAGTADTTYGLDYDMIKLGSYLLFKEDKSFEVVTEEEFKENYEPIEQPIEEHDIVEALYDSVAYKKGDKGTVVRVYKAKECAPIGYEVEFNEGLLRTMYQNEVKLCRKSQ